MSIKRLYKFAKEAGLTKTESKYAGWIATDEELLKFMQLCNRSYAEHLDEVHRKEIEKVKSMFKSFGQHCYNSGFEDGKNSDKQ